MTKQLTAEASIVINVNAGQVWNALTDPAQIKMYLFGTEATSDWQVGSSISYKGVWEGTPYEDKGTVLESEPGKKLVSTYWSGMSGKPDLPENYVTVTYILAETAGVTRVTITQDGNDTEKAQLHAASNWRMVLGEMKKTVEN